MSSYEPDSRCVHYSRTSRDLLSGSRDADDRADAPALVARLERRAHDVDVARRVEREIAPAVRHLHDVVLDAHALGQLRGVHEVRRAELARHGLFAGVRVDRDDAGCFDECGGCDYSETDGATSEDGDI